MKHNFSERKTAYGLRQAFLLTQKTLCPALSKEGKEMSTFPSFSKNYQPKTYFS